MDFSENEIANTIRMSLPDLEQFFNSVSLPKEVRLSQCETITDVKKFVRSHLDVLKANSGNPAYMPFYERLLKLKEILTKNQTK
jgi:hypothetical protein